MCTSAEYPLYAERVTSYATLGADAASTQSILQIQWRSRSTSPVQQCLQAEAHYRVS